MTGMGREMAQLYEHRRDRALHALAGRRAEALAKLPFLSDLDAEIGTIGVQAARNMLHEDSEAADQCLARLDELKSHRVRLLREAGFPADWLEMQWQCASCRDTGYMEHADGSTAGPCTCRRQIVLERIQQASNISQDPEIGFEHYTDRFYPVDASSEKYGTEGSIRFHMNAVRDHLARFAAHFTSTDTRSLYLFGPTGTGKTFLAKSAGKALLEQGKTVLYLSAPAFFETARAAKFHDADNPDAGAAYRSVIEANLLILDDLGTEPASDSRYADLLTLLEARAQPGRETKRMILATNMDLKQLKSAYNERISSRIAGAFDILSFSGADIRVLKRYG